jgi:tRNA-dihydrouridine synthase 1
MATNGNTNEEKKDDMLSPNSDSSNESSSSSSSRQQQKRLPVDRDWILKLLKKYPNPNTRNTTKALVVAPMVDQSDLPFRLLCRRYGANLCYTPMIHARLAVTMKGYREKFLGTWLSQLDRPLIAQLCGSDPDIMLQAARLVEPYVDGIDINCGCPQGIARRGFYGAFLLESENTLIPLVEHLSKHLTVPLSVKVRLLPAPDRPPHTTVAPDAPSPGGGGQATEGFDIPAASLELYGKLIKAGVHLLTIHGRTRKQKQDMTGRSDWKTIAKAVEMFGHLIPVFANGSIYDYHDVEECLQQTGVDGVMSSEAILEYPALFYRIPQEADLIVEHPVDPDAENDDQKMNQQQHSKEEYQLRQPISRRTIGRLQLAKEYMELAKEYPPEKGGQGTGLKCIRAHIHHILHKDLQEDFELRRKVVMAKDFSELEQCVVDCQEKNERENHDVAKEQLSWYIRHRPDEKEKEKQRSAAFPQRDVAEEEDSVVDEDDEGYQNCLGSLFTDGEVCGDDSGDY